MTICLDGKNHTEETLKDYLCEKYGFRRKEEEEE